MDLTYYLDRDTGKVAMVGQEIRGELAAIYQEVACSEDLAAAA